MPTAYNHRRALGLQWTTRALVPTREETSKRVRLGWICCTICVRKCLWCEIGWVWFCWLRVGKMKDRCRRKRGHTCSHIYIYTKEIKRDDKQIARPIGRALNTPTAYPAAKQDIHTPPQKTCSEYHTELYPVLKIHSWRFVEYSLLLLPRLLWPLVLILLKFSTLVRSEVITQEFYLFYVFRAEVVEEKNYKVLPRKSNIQQKEWVPEQFGACHMQG